MKLKRVCVMLLAAIMMGAGTGATVFADEENFTIRCLISDMTMRRMILQPLRQQQSILKNLVMD